MRGSPSPGDVCADGSVYAGLSPDGWPDAKLSNLPAPPRHLGLAFWSAPFSFRIFQAFGRY